MISSFADRTSIAIFSKHGAARLAEVACQRLDADTSNRGTLSDLVERADTFLDGVNRVGSPAEKALSKTVQAVISDADISPREAYNSAMTGLRLVAQGIPGGVGAALAAFSLELKPDAQSQKHIMRGIETEGNSSEKKIVKSTQRLLPYSTARAQAVEVAVRTIHEGVSSDPIQALAQFAEDYHLHSQAEVGSKMRLNDGVLAQMNEALGYNRDMRFEQGWELSHRDLDAEPGEAGSPAYRAAVERQMSICENQQLGIIASLASDYGQAR